MCFPSGDSGQTYLERLTGVLRAVWCIGQEMWSSVLVNCWHAVWPSRSHRTGCAFFPVVTVNAPSPSVTTAITTIIFLVVNSINNSRKS